MPALARPAVGPVQVLKVMHPGVEVGVGFQQVPPKTVGGGPGGKSTARLRRTGSLRSPQKTEVRNSGIRTHGGHHQPHPHIVAPKVGIAPRRRHSGHRPEGRAHDPATQHPGALSRPRSSRPSSGPVGVRFVQTLAPLPHVAGHVGAPQGLSPAGEN